MKWVYENWDLETDLGFIIQWIFVTLAGFLVSLIWIEIGERPDLGALEGAVGGLIISVSQWFVLKDHISQSWRWIFVHVLIWTIIGLTPIGLLGWVIPRTLNLTPRIVYGVIEGAKLGLCLSIGQWWVLRTEVLKPWRWIIASVLSWGIALPIGWMFGGILRQGTSFFLGDVLGLVLVWTIVAGMTGIALTRLLWYPVRSGNW
ncbi:hypothetical protein PCC9214_02749 [Planktothrix tepida]|uniref:Uncharacterized protein n=1 Tax=Planktothrix tepida PCC 9214 TaxID=671072 RepID=A0A1J1LQV9_9CYAN|nr:hypothetical protein [Planktothrix tepida]CAD5954154.1 hypothetical protein PCC9214_02749 [Planktothrix tepida]CUR34252.1 conserved membrane hypothetical protein [Planktothrix tepida PCC 9214]